MTSWLSSEATDRRGGAEGGGGGGVADARPLYVISWLSSEATVRIAGAATAAAAVDCGAAAEDDLEEEEDDAGELRCCGCFDPLTSRLRCGGDARGETNSSEEGAPGAGGGLRRSTVEGGG